MSVQLALYQPDIPQNTGTLLRTCACLNVPVHIIHPTGFTFSDKIFRRSAMDYANHVQMHEHNSFADFETWRSQNSKRLILMSTKASVCAYSYKYQGNDIILAGRESAGVPAQVAQLCNKAVRIPMRSELRSLNVAMASAMILGEALRQTSEFAGLD